MALHHSHRDIACVIWRVYALISAALLLAWKLGSRWFAIVEVLQNADYVLTTVTGEHDVLSDITVL